ncbi:MAG: beta-lactamase family protein [Bacteroidales bacterium]|nr:beta-lactamase family protein [Bacteroidales bacterium]
MSNRLIVALYALFTIAIAIWAKVLVTDNINREIFQDEYIEEPIPFAVHKYLSNLDSEIENTEKFDKTIRQFMRRYNIIGASLAIMRNDSLIYAKGYGYADTASKTETDVFHIFRVASISKLLTSTAIMMLQEEGKLFLSDSVFGKNGWLNDSVFGNYKDKRFERITIENLLRHQAGFTGLYGDPMFAPLQVAEAMNVAPPAGRDTVIQFALTKRLRFTPGHSTKYSNIGYAVLSKIIERASGMSYEEYIQKSILHPAKCYDMHLGRSIERFPNEVTYYEPGMDSVEMFDGSGRMVLRSNGGNYIEALSGAGAWVASPIELMRFLSVIDDSPVVPDILPSEVIQLMSSRGENSELPMGWMDSNNNGTWSRSGTFAGTNAMMRREANGYSWVIVTNTSRWEGPRFTRSLISLMSRAMRQVKEWPVRDMFTIEEEFNLRRLSLPTSDTTDNPLLEYHIPSI